MSKAPDVERAFYSRTSLPKFSLMVSIFKKTIDRTTILILFSFGFAFKKSCSLKTRLDQP